jgi:hypothetical protein
MYQNIYVQLILSDKIEDLCVFISLISFQPSKIIQRINISAMAINGQITEHTGGGMPLQNMSEIIHNSKPQLCETLHITLPN